jgi:DNA-binding response OmpR family regulator
MKKKILLLDESLTVQKVVALTLDRDKFAVTNAKARSEAMKLVLDAPPDLLLVSDQVAGVSVSAFPKEVEAWVGRDRRVPPLILITSQDLSEHRGYAAVLKKPFAPQALQAAVGEAIQIGQASDTDSGQLDDADDQRMQRVFNDAFSDEASLVAQTFQTEIDQEEETLLTIPAPTSRTQKRSGPPPVESVATLWGKASDAETPRREEVHVLGAEDSMAYKVQLEQQVSKQLEGYDLEEIVHRVIQKVVPAIVERLASERIEQLLKENESFVELKP